MRFSIHDVVQFTEKHKWCGCLGIIDEVKELKTDIRYMVGVPVPEGGTAYIFVMQDENVLEYVGRPVLIPRGDEDE